MAVVGGLEGLVSGRPVQEELAENVLVEELAELEELEKPPKGDGEGRLVRETALGSPPFVHTAQAYTHTSFSLGP